MKTLIILTAALVSGAAYGQQFDWQRAVQGEEQRYQTRQNELLEQAQRQQAEAQAQLNAEMQRQQLEEIQAALRQQRYELEQLSQPQ